VPPVWRERAWSTQKFEDALQVLAGMPMPGPDDERTVAVTGRAH
jgi:hypothetical protein